MDTDDSDALTTNPVKQRMNRQMEMAMIIRRIVSLAS